MKILGLESWRQTEGEVRTRLIPLPPAHLNVQWNPDVRSTAIRATHRAESISLVPKLLTQ